MARILGGILLLGLIVSCENDHFQANRRPSIGVRLFFYDPPFAVQLYDLAYPEREYIWLAADSGRIWFFNLLQWQQFQLNTTSHVKGIDFAGAGRGIAYTDHEVWRYQSSTGWMLVNSLSGIISVARATPESEFWLGTEEGQFFHWQSDSLILIQTFNSSVRDISVHPEFLVVATDNEIWRFKNNWTLLYTSDEAPLLSLAWDKPDHGYVITDSLVLEYGRYTGQISMVTLPVSTHWRDIALIADAPYVVVVGENRDPPPDYLFYLYEGAEWRSIVDEHITGYIKKVSLLETNEGWMLTSTGQLIHLSKAENISR